METKPKYNEFLKSWSTENKITSFFGSDKPEFLKDWNQAKMGKVEPAVKPVVEPIVEPVVESVVVEPVVEPKRKGTKTTITFSEADKKKMEGMTRDERINYAIRLSKKDKEINTTVAIDLFDFPKELRSGRQAFSGFFKGIIKGPLTPQNRYFKMQSNFVKVEKKLY